MRVDEAGDGYLLVDDGRELLANPLFNFVETVVTHNSKGHDVGGIPLLVEVKQRIPDAWLRKSLQVTTLELVELAARLGDGLSQMEIVPSIHLHGLLELRIHCILLPLGGVLAEARRDEELSQSIEGALEAVVGAVEVVVGVRQTGEGIVIATVVSNVFHVLVLIRVLLVSLEKHVLKEMSSAMLVFGVERGADLHIEGSGGLVGLGVVDDEASDLVVEVEISVLALVSRRFGDCS
mmetsp:Transcript_1318/g.1695  ORF Transcript_1318/g.1695 Transcript_1318/m.1695 type:complete len:236 (+) Transcript_1318:2235-2942(+)